MKAQTLKDYIEEKHAGRQVVFASANGISKQQVTVWLRNKFIVVTHGESVKLYSPRRDL